MKAHFFAVSSICVLSTATRDVHLQQRLSNASDNDNGNATCIHRSNFDFSDSDSACFLRHSQQQHLEFQHQLLQ
jgi:hypothetical protein